MAVVTKEGGESGVQQSHRQSGKKSRLGSQTVPSRRQYSAVTDG